MTALLVALAGALGTLARHLIGVVGATWTGDRFPSATLAVNLLGSFAIGFAMVLFEARQIDPRVRVALAGGLLGGFTTYSAFAYETIAMAERRSLAVAAMYAGATFAGCFLVCAGGVVLARRFVS
jgi:fluoride exporter